MTPEDDLVAAINADQNPARPRHAPEPVCWRVLTRDQEIVELDLLAGWVKWLVHRYCLDHRAVPPCWDRHGALVEELSALRTLWELCFSEDAAAADPHAFHHSLSLAIPRLESWAKRRQCSPVEHRPDKPPRWGGARSQ